MLRDKFWTWFVGGIICVILGFVCFPFFIIGAVFIFIAFYNKKEEKCPSCKKTGYLETISNEIVDTKVEKYQYIEHKHSEGDIAVPEVMPSTVTESKQYVPTSNSWNGPHEYVGTIRTSTRNIRTEHYVNNKIHIVDSDKITEIHRITRRCKLCGHIFVKNETKVRVVNNLPSNARKSRDYVDDVVMEYLRRGFEFRSNDPDINGLTYEQALKSRRIAIEKGIYERK